MVIQNLASIYLLKVNNRNTKKKVWNMFKVNNKATKTTLILNIFHTFVLVFLLLTLNMWLPAGNAFFDSASMNWTSIYVYYICFHV